MSDDVASHGTSGDDAARRRFAVLAVLGLVAVTCAILLPGITRPWGPLETNAGVYYGPFSHNWEKFGFWHLRGLELGYATLDDPILGPGYMNHPPAMAWLLYVLGTAEWQMRLPTVLSLLLSAIVLFFLLQKRLGDVAALSAGLILLVPPCVTLYGQISYELAVLVIGMVMLLAQDRLLDGGRPAWAWRTAIGLCAFVGPWFDWSFAYFCLALVPLSWGRASLVRSLCLPAVVSIASLVAIVAWQAWVLTAGYLPKPPQEGISQLAEITIMNRPALGEYLAGVGRMLAHGFTVPLMLLCAVGIVPLARKVPCMVLAFLVGILHPLVFAHHSLTHEMFYVYLAPLIAAAAAWTTVLLGRIHRALQVGAMVVAVGFPLWSTIELIRAASTPLYRELGRTLTEATGDESEKYVVANSYRDYYGHYVLSSRAYPLPTRDPAVLASALERFPPSIGVRYLWLRVRPGPNRLEALTDMPGLAAFLEPFSKVRVPELELKIDLNGRGSEIVIDEAWLVTLRDPK